MAGAKSFLFSLDGSRVTVCYMRFLFRFRITIFKNVSWVKSSTVQTTLKSIQTLACADLIFYLPFRNRFKTERNLESEIKNKARKVQMLNGLGYEIPVLKIDRAFFYKASPWLSFACSVGKHRDGQSVNNCMLFVCLFLPVLAARTFRTKTLHSRRPSGSYKQNRYL